MDTHRLITKCRVCDGSTLTEVMDFGEQYLASAFVESNQEHPLADVRVPLSTVLCGNCGLLQLKQTVKRDLLFTEYFYRSGTNPMMRRALQDIAEDVTRRVDLAPGDLVVDLGCNDGSLLELFPNDLRRLGVEPAKNISWDGLDPSITVVNDFFSGSRVLETSGGNLAKIVTSVAMLYSVEDLNTFVSEAKAVLDSEGIWCVQVSYLPATIQSLSFFDVCHEHLFYFTLKTLDQVMRMQGLRIFDASLNDVNGGSLRVFVVHEQSEKTVTSNVSRLLAEEEELGLDRPTVFEEFIASVCNLRDKTRRYIIEEVNQGNLVVGLGASTKGNVLLQFFDIDKHLLPYISERNPDKVSLRTLGTDIELVSEDRAHQLRPSTMLVLIWFFKEELIRRERQFLESGGQLLFPMPYLHVVNKDGERSL